MPGAVGTKLLLIHRTISRRSVSSRRWRSRAKRRRNSRTIAGLAAVSAATTSAGGSTAASRIRSRAVERHPKIMVAGKLERVGGGHSRALHIGRISVSRAEAARSSKSEARPSSRAGEAGNLRLIPSALYPPPSDAAAAKKRGPPDLCPFRPTRWKTTHLDVGSDAYRGTQRRRRCVRFRPACVPFASLVIALVFSQIIVLICCGL